MATPRSLAPCLRIAAQLAISAGLLLFTQCVSSYEILGDGSGGAGGVAPTGGSAGVNQGGRSSMSPWTNCNDALALGADGERCQFVDSCQTPLRDCCRTVATCNNGALNVDARCDPCPCFLDIDCGPGAWCTDGSCRACAIPDSACRLPFVLADRNGCYYCVPPLKCDADADCPAGEQCYAGQTCPPGCAEGDPSCCRGNGCAPPGCGTTASLDCVLVGCPDGQYCDITDDDHACDCYPGGWRCSKLPTNVCRPF